ncbi:MAG TPA: rRNA maturation RNase YbeY [Terriglobia bacterium]|nr:rRNA maturation RNase YbeY [Terriglobia bacterium]
MIVNHQNEIRVDLRVTREFVEKLRRLLRLGQRDFNVCFVEDGAIAALNATYRGKARSTDVLSFPWTAGDGKKLKPLPGVLSGKAVLRKATRRTTGRHSADIASSEFSNFLGDIVISTETARRNAKADGHSLAREIRWLILHGALHLLGYDHENDGGMMTALELKLRAQLRT